MGVGQEQNGDDGAGPAVITAVEKLPVQQSRFVFLNVGAFPENQISIIRKIAPAMVVFIDAAQMNLEPGEIRLLDLDMIGGLSAATHSLPFAIIGKYLQEELGCAVYVLGIQPVHNQPGQSISPLMEEVVHKMADSLAGMVL